MYVAYAVVLVSIYYLSNHLDRLIYDEGDYEWHVLLERLVLMDNEDSHIQLCMRNDAYARLINILRGIGCLINNTHNNVEEQVAQFLHIGGYNLRNRTMEFYFKRMKLSWLKDKHHYLTKFLSLNRTNNLGPFSSLMIKTMIFLLSLLRVILYSLFYFNLKDSILWIFGWRP